MRTDRPEIRFYSLEYRVGIERIRRKTKSMRFVGLNRDLLREAVQSKSERGEQLNALMKEGKLVPMVKMR